jgi:C4-dicarboxylate-specific signal transduction histidine kinase
LREVASRAPPQARQLHRGRLLPEQRQERHARQVRHATEEDLDRVAELLAELRTFAQLRERKRGSFARGSRAFLHFHEDAGDIYVDVRLDGAFQRMKVTSRGEQAGLVSLVRSALDAPAGPRPRRTAPASSPPARAE